MLGKIDDGNFNKKGTGRKNEEGYAFLVKISRVFEQVNRAIKLSERVIIKMLLVR